MSIQELLDKVSEAGVSLWDMKSYSILLLDDNGNEVDIESFKIREDDKKIVVKIVGN